MKLSYYPDTDSLYIELVEEKTSVDSREISEGIVIDLDSEGNIIGFDIDNASKKINLSELVTNKLPVISQTIKQLTAPSSALNISQKKANGVTAQCLPNCGMKRQAGSCQR